MFLLSTGIRERIDLGGQSGYRWRWSSGNIDGSYNQERLLSICPLLRSRIRLTFPTTRLRPLCSFFKPLWIIFRILRRVVFPNWRRGTSHQVSAHHCVPIVPGEGAETIVSISHSLDDIVSTYFDWTLVFDALSLC